MIKWKLMVTTLPLVGVALAIKLFIQYVIQFEGVVEFSEVGLVMTGGVFLVGFMLAGTMADYKESEKLPGELACTLETIEEILDQSTCARPSINPLPLKKAVLDTTNAIRGWLLRQTPVGELFAGLTRLNGVIQQLERDGGGAYASRAISELHSLRKTCTRIGVISRTGFLSTGYALLETLVMLILILLMVARFKTALAMCILVPFVTLIFLYMLRLIRDVDDPFEYSTDGKKGAAEADLTPFEEYRARLIAKLSAAESAAASTPVRGAG